MRLNRFKCSTKKATNLNFQWLGNAFAHLMKLPLAYFEKRHTVDIVSRFGSIQTIQHSLTNSVGRARATKPTTRNSELSVE